MKNLPNASENITSFYAAKMLKQNLSHQRKWRSWNATVKILEEGSLCLGQVKIIRCYQCGYGNSAKKFNSVTVCVKCASTDHTRENSKCTVFKCQNCEDANHNLKQNFDICHSMYDINSCYVDKQFIIQRQKIEIKLLHKANFLFISFTFLESLLFLKKIELVF